MIDEQPRRCLAWLLAPAIIIAVLGWFRAWPDTVDDAYITFRSVENFVAGHGLTFNEGTRVQGFSNPFFAATLLPFAMLGVPLETAAQLIGLLAFAGCGVLAWKLAGAARMAEPFGTLAAAATLASFPLLYYSVTGMETGLFAAMLMLAAWRWASHDRTLEWGGVLAWFAVCLGRPEGPMYFALFLPVHLFSGGGDQRRSLRNGLVLVAAVALSYCARRAYYGNWLANPYYAKPGGTADLDPQVEWIDASFALFRDFVLAGGVALPFLSLLAIKRAQVSPVLAAVASGAAAGTIFGLYTGGDWFPGGRYLLPILPAVNLLGAGGLERLSRFLPGKPAVHCALALATALVGSGTEIASFTRHRNEYPYHVMNSGDCARAAIWIRDNLPPDTHVVAHRIGALGYYSRRQVIDLFGLVDHEIAVIVRQKPLYHPANGYGDDVPELRALVAKRDPGAVLRVVGAREASRPGYTAYGFTFRFLRRFPLGTDQAWDLYVRADRFPP